MEDRIRVLLSELKARLATIYGHRLKQVCVYGSYARGEQHSESDLDILIVLDGLDDLISELSLRSGLSISRLFLSENDWRYRDTPFIANAREEAIPA
jgi:uncharacterized protein